MVFAIVGDTRPAIPDDTGNYPTAIITKIFQDIAAENPQPAFVVGTGDYVLARHRAAATARYIHAGSRRVRRGVLSRDGQPRVQHFHERQLRIGANVNMTDFEATMLSPILQTMPYYTELLHSADGSWTAKIVVIACNAWDGTQLTWLQGELANPTTYTFVVRHEA